MRIKIRLFTVFGICAGLITGSLLGASLSSAHPAPAQDQNSGYSSIDTLASDLGVAADVLTTKTNANGETYGSGLVALVTGEPMPDLVSVVMDDGNIGYVYSWEIAQPAPANPEEAVQMMEERLSDSAEDFEYVVLIARNSDGEPIGTFSNQ